MTTSRSDRLAVLAALALLGGCAADAQQAPGENAIAVEAVGNDSIVFVHGEAPAGETEAKLRAMGPEGWHRLALYGNWDIVTTEAWRWIASQPDCDRATALAIFWKAQPDYYLQYASSAAAGPDRAEYDLVALIRDRWVAGAYRRSEFAYDPDADLVRGHVDLAALRKRYGARVDRMIPASIWPAVADRHVSDEGPPLAGVIHD